MIRRRKISSNKQVKVTFVLSGDHPYGKSSVLGDFNSWDPSANKFIKRSNGTYSTSVTLDMGHHYAFRYRAADGAWFDEADADAHEPSPHGSQNNILLT